MQIEDEFRAWQEYSAMLKNDGSADVEEFDTDATEADILADADALGDQALPEAVALDEWVAVDPRALLDELEKL